jgi:hypothetical protein
LHHQTIALQSFLLPLYGFLRRCFTFRRFAAHAVRFAPFPRGINDVLKFFSGYGSIPVCLVGFFTTPPLMYVIDKRGTPLLS